MIRYISKQHSGLVKTKLESINLQQVHVGSNNCLGLVAGMLNNECTCRWYMHKLAELHLGKLAPGFLASAAFSDRVPALSCFCSFPFPCPSFRLGSLRKISSSQSACQPPLKCSSTANVSSSQPLSGHRSTCRVAKPGRESSCSLILR